MSHSACNRCQHMTIDARANIRGCSHILREHMCFSTETSCQSETWMGAGEWQKLAGSSSLGWGRHFGACPPGANSHLCQAAACPDRCSPCQGQHRYMCASTICTQSSFSLLLIAQPFKTLLLHVIQPYLHMLHLACLPFSCNVVRLSLLCCFSGSQHSCVCSGSFLVMCM